MEKNLDWLSIANGIHCKRMEAILTPGPASGLIDVWDSAGLGACALSAVLCCAFPCRHCQPTYLQGSLGESESSLFAGVLTAGQTAN